MRYKVIIVIDSARNWKCGNGDVDIPTSLPVLNSYSLEDSSQVGAVMCRPK